MTKSMNFRTHFFCLLFVSSLVGGAESLAAPTPAVDSKTTVVYVGLGSSGDFETKIKPIFNRNTSRCKNCELVNYTPEGEDAAARFRVLLKKMESLPDDAKIVLFDFNLKSSDTNNKLVELLNKQSGSRRVFVASAGAPMGQESSSPLSRTVFGQASDVLIIGDLTERDRLLPTGFYGPEMLTAIRPPKDLMGQGHGALIFTSKLATQWSKRPPQEWMEHFRNKKLKSRKLWLSLDDLF